MVCCLIKIINFVVRMESYGPTGINIEKWCFEELLSELRALRVEVAELRDALEDVLKEDDTDLQEE